MNKQRETRSIKRAIRRTTIVAVLLLVISMGIAGVTTLVERFSTGEAEAMSKIDMVIVEDHFAEVAEYRRQLLQDDIMLLARTIHSEARGESYEGKLAVATVIVNRMEHSNRRLFGGPTMEGVVYKANQFDGVKTKSFNDTPGEESVKAAEEVLLNGYRSFDSDVVFFYNPITSTDRTFIRSVDPLFQLGRHVFARQARR